MSDQKKITNRNIPLPIQREVRQRCGFGCVICGMPLYEYEHMEGWAKVQRHVADEITLLCDQHHRERTSGLLPLERVREANANPHNLKESVSKPYDFHFSGTEAIVEIGGNRFSSQDRGYGTTMIPVSIDGIPLIGIILADDHFLLNINIFNEYNELILQVKNNQLIYSTSPWDIQLVGKKLTLREAHGKILIEINFQPPNKIIITRGRLILNGVELLIRPENILLTNNQTFISGNYAEDSVGGLVLGPHSNTLSCFMSLSDIPRYLGDRTAALEFERECKSYN